MPQKKKKKKNFFIKIRLIDSKNQALLKLKLMSHRE